MTSLSDRADAVSESYAYRGDLERAASYDASRAPGAWFPDPRDELPTKGDLALDAEVDGWGRS